MTRPPNPQRPASPRERSPTPQRSRRRFVQALPAVAIAAAGAASVAATRQPRADIVHIGVAAAGGGHPTTWGGSPGGVALSFGWVEEALARQSTRVQWHFFPGAGPAVNEALASRRIDLAWQGDLPSIVARSTGLRTRILLASGVRNNSYLSVLPSSEIQGPHQLRGRRVAVLRGTNGHRVASRILAEVGLTERDVRILSLGSASAQAALVAGRIDAAFGGYESFTLRDQGRARIVYSTRDRDPALTRQAHLIGREAFIQSHPDSVQAVVDAFVRAAAWASEERNRDQLFGIWAQAGIPVSSFAAEFDQQLLADRNSPLLDPFIEARYAIVASDARELKLIGRRVTTADWFERRFLESALDRQNLVSRWTAFDASGTSRFAALASAPLRSVPLRSVPLPSVPLRSASLRCSSWSPS